MNSDNRNKTEYVKPSNLADDMGGSGDSFDERMRRLWNCFPMYLILESRYLI